MSRFFGAISYALFAISVFVCFPAMLIVLFTDVVLRYLFSSPLLWSQEFCEVTLFCAFVLALPETWRRGAHIKAEFLAASFSPRAQNVLNRIVWLLVAVFFLLAAIQTRSDAALSLRLNDALAKLDVPVVYFNVMLGVTTLFIAIYAIWAAIRLPEHQTSKHDQ